MNLSPKSTARVPTPKGRGAEEESLYRRPRQAGRIYPPHSAYALRVQLVCPIKDESSRRTDRPQPNTHQQEQQLNKPQKSLSPNPKGIIQENNILYNSGNR